MKTVNIKGKDYVEVSERIKFFRGQEAFEKWSLTTEWLKVNSNEALAMASITDETGTTIATGTAYELADSSFINKTSHIENCETSAWGRALGNLGIGIDASIASANEVANATLNQTKPAKEAPSDKQIKMFIDLYKQVKGHALDDATSKWLADASKQLLSAAIKKLMDQKNEQ